MKSFRNRVLMLKANKKARESTVQWRIDRSYNFFLNQLRTLKQTCNLSSKLPEQRWLARAGTERNNRSKKNRARIRKRDAKKPGQATRKCNVRTNQKAGRPSDKYWELRRSHEQNWLCHAQEQASKLWKAAKNRLPHQRLAIKPIWMLPGGDFLLIANAKSIPHCWTRFKKHLMNLDYYWILVNDLNHIRHECLVAPPVGNNRYVRPR